MPRRRWTKMEKAIRKGADLNIINEYGYKDTTPYEAIRNLKRPYLPKVGSNNNKNEFNNELAS